MNVSIALTLGLIAAFVCTILAFVLIIPEKRRPQLNKFWKAIHDLFNFKYLILEVVLKFIYVFVTLSCIGVGFFMLFSGYTGYGYYGSSFQSMALEGLCIMVFGPIFVRLTYEGFMMFIILVKNTIQINKKLNGDQKDGPSFDVPKVDFSTVIPTRPAEPAAPAAPAAPEAPAAPAADIFCPYCGTRQSSENNFCINCQNRIR